MIAPRDTEILLGLGARTTRSEIVERAESWLRVPVAFSRSRFHHNEHGIYRTDCSGFVSMAWGLPGLPTDRRGGLDARGLAEASTSIGWDELLAGDALLRVGGDELTRHIALFHEWADSHRTAYWGFEQSVRAGAVHHRIPLRHDAGVALCAPRRYRNVITAVNSTQDS
ncbi:NlpC/P60 family protein [Actinokineospora pegani]|uniref:hypothetical protein n=1 Tax=Actinokineospora pegani TaxID=2654637 RepID=UPI0012EAC329|nr:hypothetical protein [Actinokineospora pegani]